MSINTTIVHTWIATVYLTNGQTIEQEVRAVSIKKARAVLKRDSNIKKIVDLKKPKI